MPKTNMTFIKGNQSLPTDELFQSDNMIKVRFPVNAQSKARGIGSERMWVEVISGNAKDGVGEINNVPAFSDFNLGDLISYELNEEDGVYYFGKIIKSNDNFKVGDKVKVKKGMLKKLYGDRDPKADDRVGTIVKDFKDGDFKVNLGPNNTYNIAIDGKLLQKELKVTDFTTDWEKMRDFHKLTKEEFLKSYSYLTESEYDATAKIVKRG